MSFVAVPQWAVEEALGQHRDSCQLCVTNESCLLNVALAGSLEDGALPMPIGEIVPEVLRDLIARQQRRVNAALNGHAEERLFHEGNVEPIRRIDAD